MGDTPATLLLMPDGYGEWLAALKVQIFEAQQRAAQAVNLEQMVLYWSVGNAIAERKSKEGWGTRVVRRLANDLRAAFPDVRGGGVISW